MSLLLAAAQNADAPVLVAQNVAFGIIAAIMVFGAVRVVTTANVVHAAVYLVIVLAGATTQIKLINNKLKDINQMMIYIGAIVVLFLFGIMLTRAPMLGTEKPSRDNWIVGAGTSLVMLVVLVYVLLDGFGRDKLPADLAPTDTRAVSDSIFGVYLVPFEVLSVLLLAALIGAIVIARRD